VTPTLALDTSVVVPALVRSHEAHAAARSVLAERPVIPAQVAVESYSVLTRLPLPLRVRGAVAADLLARTFPVIIPLDEDAQNNIVGALAAAGIVGGSVYDGVVALTARAAGVRLCSRDRRAGPTYAALGVDVRWLD
jgi:predicted nucleic acid-binding protein